MNRRQHYLKGNKKSELPHNAVWVDTETRQRRVSPTKVKHILRFGWGCHQRTRELGDWTDPDWFRFTTAASFWRAVIRRARDRTRLYVFAHNLSFDAVVLDTFRILPALGFKLTSAIMEGPPVVLVWRRDKLTIEMLDTLNWWRTSLATLGESIGIPKLPMPKDRASKAQWDRYCRNDVEVIRRAVMSWWGFLGQYDLGGFARTLAGQSLRAFRHRFMDSEILIDSNEPALELARESYHGGRTEAFHIGRLKGPIHCLDVNSMYPFVMREESYPTVLRLFTRQATFPELARWVQKYAVIARVQLETPVPRYAVVSGDKLLFPVGRFTAALTTPDLAFALKSGHVRKVLQASVYDRFPIFARFVSEIYKLRLEAAAQGNDVHKYLLKILLNSLYGKFAQRGTNWETFAQAEDLAIKVWSDIDVETGTVRDFRQFAGLVQIKATDPEARDSHPAIASHVTAYARALLWDLMTVAGRSNVYYCDTDSLYVNDEGFQRLETRIDPSALGALKHEASYPWFVIHGAKDYATPKGKVCKGVRATADWFAPDAVRQEKWSSLRGLLRSEDLSAPTTELIEKRMKREYSKGTVTRSGAVLPLRLTCISGSE